MMLGMLVQQVVNRPRPVKRVIKPSGPPLCPLCPPEKKVERMLLSTGKRTSYCKDHNKEVSRTNFKNRQLRLKEAGL